MSLKADYRLYLVTEESVPLDKLVEIVEKAMKGGVTMVQLREKKTEGGEFYKKAKILKRLLDRDDIPLIINDRVDIALAVSAAGVHVGQQDLPLPEVRKIVPASMIVGVSVSTMNEAREAELHGASYIGVGAVFPTTSKQNAKVLPEGSLEAIVRSVSIPTVAIGGITLDKLRMLQSTKVTGVAVVSAIMQADDPYQAARQFRAAWA